MAATTRCKWDYDPDTNILEVTMVSPEGRVTNDTITDPDRIKKILPLLRKTPPVNRITYRKIRRYKRDHGDN